MEGLRRVGEPATLAERYASEGADELLYIDSVASLYGRNQLEELLERTTRKVFIPVTVGGGISSLADVQRLLNAGADKVAVNTAAIRRPALINEIAGRYGNQCLVVSIEAKRTRNGWECYTDCGRERTGIDAVSWAAAAVERGAGEILVTSVEQDGTVKGLDHELIKALSFVEVPLTASGGLCSVEDAKKALQQGCDALAVGAALHQGKINLGELRHELTEINISSKRDSPRRAYG